MTGRRVPWWLYVAALSFVGFAIFTFHYDFMAPETAGMISYDYTDGNLHLRAVHESSPLARAGVRDDDRIVAVDRAPIRSVEDWHRQRMMFEVGRPIDLAIVRGDVSLHASMVLETGRLLRTEGAVGWLNYLAWRGAMFSLLVFSTIVFLRPDDVNVRLWAATWAAIAVFEPTGSPVGPTGAAYGWTAAWRHLPLPASLFLAVPCLVCAAFPPLLFSTAATFPRKFFTGWRSLVVCCVPGIVCAVFVFHDIWPLYDPPPFIRQVQRPAWIAWFALAALYLGAGVVVVTLNFRRLTDVNDRRRIKAIVPPTVFGTAVLIHGLLTVQWAQWFHSGPPAIFSTPAFAVDAMLFECCLVALAYAILKHRIFDLALVIRRGIQYALARGVLIWSIPAALAVFLLDVFMHEGDIGLVAVKTFAHDNSRSWFYGALGAGFGVGLSKRRQWLEQIDRRFFRERYSAQRVLREVAEEVRAARSLGAAAPAALARIVSALHPEFAGLMARAPDDRTFKALVTVPADKMVPQLAADSKLMVAFRLFPKPLDTSSSQSSWLRQQLPPGESQLLSQAQIDLMIPIALAPSGREAFLALGRKKSEEPYSSEDHELLLAIANSLAGLLERPVEGMPASFGFSECSQCGRCFDGSVGQCAEDGSPVVLSQMPRVLAGRYRIDRRLGKGGMGTVYSAFDTSLERDVAVKVVREELVASADAAERFKREAKAAAAFRHPNVVTIHDFAIDATLRAFLVMELLRGRSVRQELEHVGRCSPQRTLDIFRAVGSAIGVAHQRGVTHRDLKPDNIFLADEAGGVVPKILDFGLAKFVASGSSATKLTMQTGAGTLVGTPAYMSPEQLHGGPVSASWDLWALAVIAYEMLLGDHPFGACQSVAAMHNAILSARFTPPSHIDDAYRGKGDAFFVSALSLDSRERPDSAEAFTARLEETLALA